jgi:hypothetical protein
MSRSRSRRLAAPVALVAALVLAPAAPAAAAHGITKIATGLNAPRGMDVGPDGHLYVAEAGSAGTTCSGTGASELCVGATGSISRVARDGSGQERVQAGLSSILFRGEPVGPHDVSFRGRADGYVLIGLGADPARRAELGDVGAGLGKLYRWTPGSAPSALADVAGFEAARNPDGIVPDSNPWSVDSTNGDLVVTDAGANAILSVAGASGDVALKGLLPFGVAPGPTGVTIPFQPVPTGIVRARHGSYRVGQLTGFPFPDGAAKVFKLVDTDVNPFATGFTHVIDVAYGPDGTLYVLMIARRSLRSGPSPGMLVAVRRNGSRYELAKDKLTAPAGLAVHGSHIYVSNQGLAPGAGEVLRIPARRW